MTKSKDALERLLNTSDLSKIVPRLEPQVLHQLIQARGLEDCAALVALATPGQLARVLDSDVWRAGRPGVDEAFDPDRFGLWLTVLMESGASLAAEKLVGLDIDLVIAGLAHHIAVFEYAAAAPYTTFDGEQVAGRTTHDGLASELGGYVIEAARTPAWDAIVDLLAFLETERPDYFHRLMGACSRMSNGPREQDGFHDLLDDRAQHMFDLAYGREDRRERHGYVAPAQAAGFLHAGRALRLDAGRPPRSAIARGHFRAMKSTAAANTDTAHEVEVASAEAGPETTSQRDADRVAALVDVLARGGWHTTSSRALVGAAGRPASGLSFTHAHAMSHPDCEEELAFLANTLVAGCSIQGRPFTVREASDCAVGTCNLGLENWPPHWSERDLITAFQVGWTILHRDVCMYTAERLIDVLSAIECMDRDIQLRLDGLRRGLIKHVANREPWRVGDAVEVILVLDAPSWAGLRALIDECPVIHAAVSASRSARRAISPTDFEFISQASQIAVVRQFLAALPALLTL